MSMSDPKTEDGRSKCNELRARRGYDWYFMICLEKGQLTISVAGMVWNCCKEFQRGSSEGNMNSMRGRRNNRVDIVSVSLC